MHSNPSGLMATTEHSMPNPSLLQLENMEKWNDIQRIFQQLRLLGRTCLSLFQHFPSGPSTQVARAGQCWWKATWKTPCRVLVCLFPEKGLGMKREPCRYYPLRVAFFGDIVFLLVYRSETQQSKKRLSENFIFLVNIVHSQDKFCSVRLPLLSHVLLELPHEHLSERAS